MAKNILQLTGMNSTKYGGLEQYFVELVRACPDYRFSFLFESKPKNEKYVEELLSGGARLFCQSTSDSRKYISYVSNIIVQEKIDIVHFHFAPIRISPLLKIRFPRVTFIATIHLLYYPTSFKGKIMNKLSFLPFKRILCVSEGTKQSLINYVGKSRKYQVLYLGVKTNPVINEKLKKDLQISQETVVLTSIGFSIRVKGFDVFLESIKNIVARKRLKHEIKVLIVGVEKNSEEDRLLNDLIIEKRLSDIVIPLGIRNDIQDIMNITDVYIQASRTEAISLSIMEAMRHSVPVIGSNVGGVPEVVHDGENGFLFPKESIIDLSDRIVELVNNDELRQSMGLKSKSLSSVFSIENSIREMTQEYNR